MRCTHTVRVHVQYINNNLLYTTCTVHIVHKIIKMLLRNTEFRYRLVRVRCTCTCTCTHRLSLHPKYVYFRKYVRTSVQIFSPSVRVQDVRVQLYTYSVRARGLLVYSMCMYVHVHRIAIHNDGVALLAS